MTRSPTAMPTPLSWRMACGVALVSGFSQNVARMVLSGTFDPYVCLMEQLHFQRYQPVWDALKANE